MRSIIQQSVVLPAAADELFEMYLDPARHAAITGASATIARQSGSPFEAFGGRLTGTILAVVAPRLIVQWWRSIMFKASDPDSTLVLTFSSQPDLAGRSQGRIDLVHLDVPDHDYQGVTDGWPKFYWTPWRAYLDKD
jgi:activator of HSP90 ATPase